MARMIEMNQEEVLLIRKIRRRIAELCNDIFWGEWNAVCIQFHEIEKDLAYAIKEDSKEWEMLRQCRQCVGKRNILRLRDLLAYELDDRLAERLFLLPEWERTSLANNAKVENEETLRAYHPNIYDELYSESENQIDCHYEGTDNVTLTAWENGRSFRLFSNTNPWRESIDIVNYLARENKNPQEICVLGFGGGYTVGELIRRFPRSKIKVFLPNIDIFKMVIEHILVNDILQNKNLEIYPDSMCLYFLLTVKESAAKNDIFNFYIDRRELRACVCNTIMQENLIRECRKEQFRYRTARVTQQELVGGKIERYIMDIVDNR